MYGLSNNVNVSPLEHFPQNSRRMMWIRAKLMFLEVLMVGYKDFRAWVESIWERKRVEYG